MELYIAWQLDPVLIGGIVALAFMYFLATGPLRERIAPGEPFPVRNSIFFYSAMIVFYLAEGSPLHDLAERYSLLAHMFQHNIVSFVVAPLMLAGLPVWLARWLFTGPRILPIVRFLVHPIPAFFIFSIGYSMWHLPVVYDAALRNPALHHFEHVVFLVTSLVVWWPIMSRVPELPPPGRLGQLAFLFLLPIAQMVAFSTITFGDHVLYPTYALAPTWIFADQLSDQTAAGALMKLTGFVAFGVPFIVIFFRWYREQTGRDLNHRPLPAPASEVNP